MDGRAFLESARLLLATPSEANRRSAVGREYFAVLNEARSALDRWGFVLPSNAVADDDNSSAFLLVPNKDLLRVVDALTRLKQNRRDADNDLTGSGVFADDIEAKRYRPVGPNRKRSRTSCEGDRGYPRRAPLMTANQ